MQCDNGIRFSTNKPEQSNGSKQKITWRKRRSSMVGRSRIERCGSCGFPILVRPLASAAHCTACNSTTRFHNPRASAAAVVTTNRGRQDPIQHVRGWLKVMFSKAVSSSESFRPNSGFHGASIMGWPATFPATRAKKRAVLVGVSYSFRSYELKGTVNDVNYMRHFLCEKFQFISESILVLTEEESDPNRIPTKENIRAAMRWLVRGSEPGDSLIFHFSGHGSQKLDPSGDEADGFAETLCPVDYEENGVILDDEINETLVRPICPGAKLHAIIDSCHSGTVLDLPFLCRMSRGAFYQWEDHKPKSGKFKGTSGGLAICISGCDDNQTAQDTQALSGSVTTGAMTYSLIYALETDPGTTYGRLLCNMRSVIRGVDAHAGLTGPIASFMKRVLSCGLKQICLHGIRTADNNLLHVTGTPAVIF